MTRTRLARHTLLVTGVKGGVGKSTVSASLAVYLAQRSLRVGVLDADLSGASIPGLLGCDARPGVSARKLIPVLGETVKVMSTALFAAASDPLAWRGPLLRGLLRQFIEEVAWGELDVLIVDMPAGAGELHSALHDRLHVDAGIVVTTSSRITRDLSNRARAVLDVSGIPVGATVLNRHPSICQTCGGAMATMAPPRDVAPVPPVSLPELPSKFDDLAVNALAVPGYRAALAALAAQLGWASTTQRQLHCGCACSSLLSCSGEQAEPNVSRSEREQARRQRGATLWLTGPRGAGHTALASALERRLLARGCATVLLDRASIQLGIEKVAELFHEAGVLCLCAFSEPCHAERARLREQLPAGDFVEIQLGQLAPCEAAENPALVLASATEDLTGCVNRVLQFLEANDYVANASLT